MSDSDSSEENELWREVAIQLKKQRAEHSDRDRLVCPRTAATNPAASDSRISSPDRQGGDTEAIRSPRETGEGETLWYEIQCVRRKLRAVERTIQGTDDGANSTRTIPTQEETLNDSTDSENSQDGAPTPAPTVASLESTNTTPSVQAVRPGVEPGAYRVRPQGRVRVRQRRAVRRIDTADDDSDDDEDYEGSRSSFQEESTVHSQHLSNRSTLDVGLVHAEPVYDEYEKPSVLAQATPLRRKVRLLLVSIMMIVLLLTVIGVAVAISVTRAARSSSGGSAIPTSAPTSASPLNTSVLLNQFYNALPTETAAALEEENSPQSQAYRWINSSIQLDTLLFQQESPQSMVLRLTQRFALATLYYATNGAEWINQDGWLDANVGECTWTGCSCAMGPGIYALDLEGNGLVGTVPLEISFLSPSLNLLKLESNTLKGTIPSHLGMMSSLQQLLAGATQLQGSIPSSLGSMTSLTWLDLSQNNLEGPIPSTLGRLSSLTYLILSDNSLTGSLPTDLGLARNLESIQVSGNTLTGQIPSSLSALTNLKVLQLNLNEFSGTLSSNLGLLTSLNRMFVSGNDITGSVPGELCEMVSNGLNLQVDCDEVSWLCVCCDCASG